MSFIDGFLEKMNLGGGYDDEDEEYDDYNAEDDKEAAPKAYKKKPEKVIKTREKEEHDEESAPYKQEHKASKPERQTFKSSSKSSGTNGRVVNMHSGSLPMEVCVIRPNNVDGDAREIAETLLTGRAIVINLEGLDMDIAQRIIDFTSGACFAIDGKLKKISNFIFIATPKAISISGDLFELMGGQDVSFSSESDF